MMTRNKVVENRIKDDDAKIQVSLRLRPETLKKLKKGAKARNIPINTYLGMILEKAARYLETKDDALIMDRKVIRGAYGNHNRLEESAIDYAEEKVSEWKASREPWNLETFERRFTEWHSLNKFKTNISNEIGKTKQKIENTKKSLEFACNVFLSGAVIIQLTMHSYSPVSSLLKEFSVSSALL